MQVSYRQACKLIANMDVENKYEKVEALKDYVTVRMMAELFDKDEYEVAVDVNKVLRKVRKAQEEAKANGVAENAEIRT